MIVGKAVQMAEMMKVPILGIVENMSYVLCPDCGKHINVFGDSHVDEIADKYKLGMEGPVMSASSTPALKPRRRIETASIALVMLLPTPPLPETTPITFWIRLRSCGGSCCGARWSQLALQLLQSWVHSLMVCLLL